MNEENKPTLTHLEIVPVGDMQLVQLSIILDIARVVDYDLSGTEWLTCFLNCVAKDDTEGYSEAAAQELLNAIVSITEKKVAICSIEEIS